MQVNGSAIKPYPGTVSPLPDSRPISRTTHTGCPMAVVYLYHSQALDRVLSYHKKFSPSTLILDFPRFLCGGTAGLQWPFKIPAKPITFDTGKQSAEIAGRFPSTPCTTDPHLLEAQNAPASSSNRKRVKHDANFYRRIGSADEKIRIDICMINMSLLDMQNGKGFLGALTASFILCVTT